MFSVIPKITDNSALEGEALCDAAAVKRFFGGKSDMWLWRREKTDPDFPKPIVIGNRKHFRIRALVEYARKKEGHADAGTS